MNDHRRVLVSFAVTQLVEVSDIEALTAAIVEVSVDDISLNDISNRGQ